VPRGEAAKIYEPAATFARVACSRRAASSLVGPSSSGRSGLPSAYTHAAYCPQGLSTAPFNPALYDTFAIITRPGTRLSPGVRELLTDLEAHMLAVADEFDRSRRGGAATQSADRPRVRRR
jgi:hypothetical protein